MLRFAVPNWGWWRLDRWGLQPTLPQRLFDNDLSHLLAGNYILAGDEQRDSCFNTAPSRAVYEGAFCSGKLSLLEHTDSLQEHKHVGF